MTVEWLISDGIGVRANHPDFTPTDHLSFDMPSRDRLYALPRKAWAHYFTEFRLAYENKGPSGDTATDIRWRRTGNTSTSNYMPGGPNTTWQAYGGYARDRPKIVPHTHATGTAWTTNDYRRWDRQQQVEWAVEAGWDGFTLELIQNTRGQTDNHFDSAMQLLQVVDEMYPSGGFDLVLMPDGRAHATDTTAGLITALAEMCDSPNIYRHGGKIILAPYAPERAPWDADTWGVTGWQTVIDGLESATGEQVEFWACYQDTWTSAAQAPTFDAIATVHGRWGDRAAGDILDTSARDGSNTNYSAKDYAWSTFGKAWWHWISAQDIRPREQLLWEGNNSEALRNTWRVAIEQNIPWLQGVTWSDYAEGAHLEPSENKGHCLLDISAYYLTWWKTGVEPTIVRPCIYLSHRPQFMVGTSQTSPTAPESSNTYTGTGLTYPGSKIVKYSGSESPIRDRIEALVDMPADGIVRIKVGGVAQDELLLDGITPFTLTITGSPTGGTYTLTVTTDGTAQTTAAIAYNANAAAIEAAIVALSNVFTGDVTVTGTAPTFSVEFGGGLTSSTVTMVRTTNSLTGGTSPNATVAATNASATSIAVPAGRHAVNCPLVVGTPYAEIEIGGVVVESVTSHQAVGTTLISQDPDYYFTSSRR